MLRCAVLQNRWRKRGLAVTPTKFGIAFTKLTYNQGGALVHVYTDGTVGMLVVDGRCSCAACIMLYGVAGSPPDGPVSPHPCADFSHVFHHVQHARPPV